MPTCNRCDKVMKKGYIKKYGSHWDEKQSIWSDSHYYICKIPCEDADNAGNHNDCGPFTMKDDIKVDKFIARYMVVTDVIKYLSNMMSNPDINEYQVDAIELCADTLIELKNPEFKL